MIAEYSSTQKRLFHITVVTLLTLTILAGTLFLLAHVSRSAQTSSGFTFTALGDYAETSDTTANLNYIAQSGASFNLALGDLNYSPSKVSASAYASYVQSHLPVNFPFEIIAGNEDQAQLSALATDLPDHIGNISGNYAKEYYFDYPPGSPLARFIMVSPGGVVAGYNYTKGTSHYNWVSQQIDGARSAGIPWVIVGMHEPCIYVNTASQSGPCSSIDLLNLLVSKNVDLILYGHKHNYQASKQIAFNGTTCTSLTAGKYNSNCVVNSSSSLVRGAGPVMVIDGTGGETPLMGTSSSDPNAGYYRKWEGGSSNATWGVLRITVSATLLSVKFVGTSGGSFSDGFTVA